MAVGCSHTDEAQVGSEGEPRSTPPVAVAGDAAGGAPPSPVSAPSPAARCSTQLAVWLGENCSECVAQPRAFMPASRRGASSRARA